MRRCHCAAAPPACDHEVCHTALARRRRVLTVAALVAVAATVVGLPSAGASSQVSFVQVVQKEFTLTLSRPSVQRGTVSVELVNFGMDAHDLIVLKKTAGAKPIAFKRLDPRGRTNRTLKLSAGRYSLWCSIADHRSRGMRATLVVR
jgi:plastocyanin